MIVLLDRYQIDVTHGETSGGSSTGDAQKDNKRADDTSG